MSRRDVYALGDLASFLPTPPPSSLRPSVMPSVVIGPAPAKVMFPLHPASPTFNANGIDTSLLAAAAAPKMLFNSGGFAASGGGGASSPSAPQGGVIPLPLGDVAKGGIAGGALVVGGVVAAGLVAWLLLRRKR